MTSWDAVFTELEAQLNFADVFRNMPIESRNRTTMQCQRLLPEHEVALAVPVIAVKRDGSDDPSGEHIVGFTDIGPWLFRASKNNPGLPKDSIGPLTDAAPMSFGPHARHGGELRLGERLFLVRNAYADRVRSLITDLATAEQQPVIGDEEE